MTDVNPDLVSLIVPDSLGGDASAVEALYATTDMQEDVDLMTQVLEPYLTEEALAELGSSRQELHIQGGNES